MRITLFAILLILFYSLNGFSHGEDKPGPNGGYVRMPGAFHTEVVLDGAVRLKIYLLDINWVNPSIKDSSVQVQLKGKKIIQKADCQIVENYYQCSFLEKVDLNAHAKLLVKAKRESQVGNEVSYELPLKFEKSVR